MPLDLYNVATQTVETVPDQHIAEAIASGKYTPRKDAQIPAIAPNGELGYLEPTKAAEAFKKGFTFDTQGLMSKKVVDERNAETYDHPIAAGALAAADTALMGLPSQLLTKTGIATPGQLNMLAEQNPIATPIGEGVGLVGSLLTGEGGPAAIAKATTGLEKQFAKTLFREGDGFIKTLAGKVLSKSAAGAADALAFGTGSFIREEAMGNVDFNAESYLQYQKPYVMWGAALGGATGALSTVVPPAYRAMSNKIRSLVSKAEDLEMPEGLARAHADIASKAMGRPEQADTIYKQWTDKVTQANVKMTDEQVANRLVKQAESTADVMGGMMDDLKKFEDGKFANIRKVINKQVDLAKAVQNADDTATLLINKLDNLNHPENAFIAEKEIFKSLDNEKNQLVRYIDKVRRGEIKAEPWNVYEKLNSTKKNLDNISKAGKKIVGYSAEQTIEYARGISNMVRESLTDPLRWGQAGGIQQELNTAFSNVMNHIHGNAKTGGDLPGIKKFFFNNGLPDLVKARNFARNVAKDAAFAAQHMPAVEAFYGALKEYDDVVTRNLAKVGEGITKEGASAFIADVQKGQEVVNRILQDRAASKALLTGAQGAGTDITELAAGSIGGALFGGPGYLVGGGLAKLFTNPGKTTALYMGIKSANLKVAGDITKGVRNFFAPVGRAASKVAPVIRPASAYALARLTPSGGKAKSREDGFKEWAQFLGEYQTNPERIVSNIAENTNELGSVMPKTGAAAQQKTIAALDYLTSKLPQNPHLQSPFDSHAKDWVPNKQQLAEFERIVTAVHNPLSIVDHLRKGILTKEEVDAVKATRPQIYNKVLSSITDYMSENSAKVPFNKKANLSTLFGVPFDSMLTGESVLQMQKNFLAPPTPKMPTAPNQGAKLKFSGGLTETQRLTSKKDGNNV